jgi:hypothetical protein
MHCVKHRENQTLLPVPANETRRVTLQNNYVPDFKAKSKSKAGSHAMEFLSRVFSSDGASRFFKTFLLRFLFDGNAGDDCSGSMIAAVL